MASAGLDNDADVVCTPELVEWAHLFFVMETTHKTKLNNRFKKHLGAARIVCLDIPDKYEFMQPELIALLDSRVDRHLRRGVNAGCA